MNQRTTVGVKTSYRFSRRFEGYFDIVNVIAEPDREYEYAGAARVCIRCRFHRYILASTRGCSPKGRIGCRAAWKPALSQSPLVTKPTRWSPPLRVRIR
jgi:hypothetical protein